MDRLFSAFKICCYRNRQRLYHARFATDGRAVPQLRSLPLRWLGTSFLEKKGQLSNGKEIVMEPTYLRFELLLFPRSTSSLPETYVASLYWPASNEHNDDNNEQGTKDEDEDQEDKTSHQQQRRR
jgi:hypothetical protein